MTFFLLLFLIVACASGGAGEKSQEPARSVVRVSDYQTAELFTEADRISVAIPHPPEDVWAALPAVFDRLGIPVNQVARDQMTLGNTGLEARTIEGKRMGSYLDCGTTFSGALANIYDVTLKVTSRVTPNPEGGALVVTTLDAWAEPRMTNGDAVHCRSKNKLEERIAEVTAEILEKGRP